jgi:hypothetical protein
VPFSARRTDLDQRLKSRLGTIHDGCEHSGTDEDFGGWMTGSAAKVLPESSSFLYFVPLTCPVDRNDHARESESDWRYQAGANGSA